MSQHLGRSPEVLLAVVDEPHLRLEVLLALNIPDSFMCRPASLASPALRAFIYLELLSLRVVCNLAVRFIDHMSARSLKTPELVSNCVFLVFIGVTARFSACNSPLSAVAIDADIADGNFLAQVADESFEIDEVVRVGDEKTMGDRHMLQVGG